MKQSHWSFASDRAAAAEARAKLREALGDVIDEQRDIAVLLTSELFSNAVLHGAAPIEIDVARVDDTVRVTVHDASPAMPVPSEANIDKPSGRGLLLVDSLSQRWGVTVNPQGKAVWFEVTTGLLALAQRSG